MHDVIIIGGSFAGLAAALQLGRARRDVLVLDTGQPRNRFSAHSHGFLTRDGAPPLALLEEARSEFATYPSVTFREGRATGAARTESGFDVGLAGGEALGARYLILAYGMTDDLSVMPRGAGECWGKSLFFCPYCHGFEVADRRLGLLLRHGDALELSRFYREWTHDFTLFTNGAQVDPLVRRTLADEGVAIVDDTIMALEHDEGNLRVVATAAGSVPMDALFSHPPALFSTSIGVDLGCATREGNLGPYFEVDHRQQTSVPGIFAAGDIARPAPAISFAVADGVAAGIAVHRALIG